MANLVDSPSLIPATSLKSFFHGALQEAAQTQRVSADDAVIAYLTQLLTDYARSERLYDRTDHGVVRRPLFDLYRLAAEAGSTQERRLLLQRLGDLALFVSAVLPDSLQRSLVDVDYYISMGSSAYGFLSDAPAGGIRVDALRGVFGELSARFVEFVDLLAETAGGHQRSHPDLWRLHELWCKTGSRRLHRMLLDLGLTPQAAGRLN
jgi:hypothetical protein